MIAIFKTQVTTHLVQVDPSTSFPEASVNAVLPDTGGQVDLSLRGAGSQNRRNNELLAQGKFVGEQPTGRVQRVEHPQRPHQGESRVQRLLRVLLEQRVHLQRRGEEAVRASLRP